MLCQAEHKTSNEKWKLRNDSAFTIEVITGLSQGELLKLDDSPILIGGNEDCDIYLSEPNLSQASLVAELSAGRVRISPIHNSGADAYFGAGKFKKSISEPTYFSAGDSFCLEGVWLKISNSKSESNSDSISLSHQSSTQEEGHTYKPKQNPNDLSFDTPSKLDDILQSRTILKAFEFDTDDDGHFLRWAGLKAGSLFLSSIGICALTISVAQGVNKPTDLSYSQSHPQEPVYSRESFYQEGSHQSQEYSSGNYGESLLADIRANIEKETKPNRTASTAKPSTNTSKQVLVSEQDKLPYLKSIFSQMLSARELPQTVSLSHEKGVWIISGHLDKEKLNVLNRMIERFKSEQDIKNPVTNNVKSAFSSLPFEIVQVTSGRYGNIVTQAGDRLFVGDQLDGYQLVAIQDHQLVFTGKSRVTVAW